MTRQKYILIISTAFIIAVLHFIINPYRLVSYNYNLKLGQISEKNIIAPFEFKIYKNDETIIAEQEAAAAKIRPIYKVSENLKYNAQKNLDFILINNESENIRDNDLYPVYGGNGLRGYTNSYTHDGFYFLIS